VYDAGAKKVKATAAKNSKIQKGAIKTINKKQAKNASTTRKKRKRR